MAWPSKTHEEERSMAASIVAGVADGRGRWLRSSLVFSSAGVPLSDRSSVADLAAPLLDAVVNISTSQTVTGSRSGDGVFRRRSCRTGSPFQDFFDEFFNQRDGARRQPPAAGPVAGFRLRHRSVRNHRHQQSRHRGRRRDHRQLHRRQQADRNASSVTTRRPISRLLQVKADKPLTAVKFGDSQRSGSATG